MKPEYKVIDGQTSQIVGKPFASLARARTKAERLDLEYGAYRYYVKGPITTLPAPTEVQ
jgi:hypothetical protein